MSPNPLPTEMPWTHPAPNPRNERTWEAVDLLAERSTHYVGGDWDHGDVAGWHVQRLVAQAVQNAVDYSEDEDVATRDALRRALSYAAALRDAVNRHPASAVL